MVTRAEAKRLTKIGHRELISAARIPAVQVWAQEARIVHGWLLARTRRRRQEAADQQDYRAKSAQILREVIGETPATNSLNSDWDVCHGSVSSAATRGASVTLKHC
jgi:hypothetical protein